MTDEIIFTSTPKKTSKRPRLECETSFISILPENQVQFNEPQEPQTSTSSSSILEDLKNEVLSCHESSQTSPQLSPIRSYPRTRTVSVCTEHTGDLDGPIINIPENPPGPMKTESLSGLSKTSQIDFDDKNSQTDPIEFKKRPEELKSTNAGSTWFQMVALTDPCDFAEKRKPKSVGVQTEVIPDAMLIRLNQLEKEFEEKGFSSESEDSEDTNEENESKSIVEDDSDDDEDSTSKSSKSSKSSKKEESNILTRATSSLTNFFSLR